MFDMIEMVFVNTSLIEVARTAHPPTRLPLAFMWKTLQSVQRIAGISKENY